MTGSFKLGRFANFHQIKAVSYGSIRGKALPTDIFLPKTGIASNSGPRPILVVLHGGALIGGHRTFEPWWPVYLLEYAAAKNAIVVAPDYPLAPESQSPEIVQGLQIFLDWLLKPGALQSAISENLPGLPDLPAASSLRVEADLSRILLDGESAGGWAALHLAYRYPDAIRGLILRYPMLDLDNRAHFSRDFGANEFLGKPLPPSAYFDEHVASMPEGSIALGGEPDRFTVLGATLLRGRLIDALAESDDTFPLRRLQRGEVTRLPPKIWVLHGLDDKLVPVSGSTKLADLLREKVPMSELEYDTRPGDHAFDHEFHYNDEETFFRKRLDWLGKQWLQ